MKLVWKLSLTLTGSMCLLFTVYALTNARAQVELFQADKEAAGRLVGHSTAAAVASELEFRGVEAAKHLTTDIDARDTDVSVHWVSLDPNSNDDRPIIDIDLDELEAAGQFTLVAPNRNGVDAVLTYTLLPSRTSHDSAIEIAQSLSDRAAFVREATFRASVSLLLMILASALATAMVGIFWVGRPVKKLLEKSRAITRGDFLTELHLSQRDEFGMLGAALIEAGQELENQRAKVNFEHQERLQAEGQMRHAERLATVGKLASGFAHEIGTPLNVVSGYAGLITANEEAPEACREGARIIRRQTVRISKIVRELLDFARHGEGQSRKEEHVDLVAISRSTLALVKTMKASQGKELSLSAETEPLETKGDASHLQQVLINLLINGLHALEDRGRLSVELAPTRAKSPNATEGVEADYVRLSVIDDGIGIADKDLPRLFEPFFTTKDVGEGTGLGLSVVYGIVQDHHGWLDVHSSLGEGSQFDVYLPMI